MKTEIPLKLTGISSSSKDSTIPREQKASESSKTQDGVVKIILVKTNFPTFPQILLTGVIRTFQSSASFTLAAD